MDADAAVEREVDATDERCEDAVCWLRAAAVLLLPNVLLEVVPAIERCETAAFPAVAELRCDPLANA